MDQNVKKGSEDSRAFTLIELLVVIAIIAILAAILFPVFAQAKEGGGEGHRLPFSNTKEIGLGQTQIYVGDTDGVYPQSKMTDANPQIDDVAGAIENPDNGSIFAKILPYTGHGGSTDEDAMYQQRLYACPDDPNPFDLSCPDIINIGGPHVISYLINAYFVWGLNESGVGVPASVIEYGERRSVTVNGAPPYCDDIYHPWFNSLNPNLGSSQGLANGVDNEMDTSTGAVANSRHNGGANYTFADGHSKRYQWIL